VVSRWRGERSRCAVKYRLEKAGSGRNLYLRTRSLVRGQLWSERRTALVPSKILIVEMSHHGLGKTTVRCWYIILLQRQEAEYNDNKSDAQARTVR
jgi:hypothetical protein